MAREEMKKEFERLSKEIEKQAKFNNAIEALIQAVRENVK